jgi:hypothetical protein
MKLFNTTLIALCAFIFLACQSAAPTVSPTEVLKAQNEAQKKKDGAAMKQNLSKSSLALIEKAAKAQNKTVEELLTLESPDYKQPESFEYRNEKIEGDTATVEIKPAGFDAWGKAFFVKEDGRWKYAIDKTVAEADKVFRESQPAPAN